MAEANVVPSNEGPLTTLPCEDYLKVHEDDLIAETKEDKDIARSLYKLIDAVNLKTCVKCVLCNKSGDLVASTYCGNVQCNQKTVHEECLEDFLFQKMGGCYKRGSQVRQHLPCPICNCITITLDYEQERQILERFKEKERALVSKIFILMNFNDNVLE